MININNQETLFNEIGKNLPKNLIVYSIGGTAMMLQGLKGETLDIDLVFDKENDRNVFINTLKTMKFREDQKRVIEIYGVKKNTPEMFRLESNEFIFDLFLNKVISSIFSDGMKKRATRTHEFGTKLVIKAANPHDILIIKSVTGRAKDHEDIVSIINSHKIDWKIIIEEASEQVRLGKEKAIMVLGEKLENLISQNSITIPKSVLDTLWKLFSKQVKDKSKK